MKSVKSPSVSGNSHQDLLLSEQKYKSLFDLTDQGYCLVKVRLAPGYVVDYQFIEINRAFEKLTGLVDAVGKWMRELRPGHEEYWFEKYAHVALTGESVQFEHFARELDHRWYRVNAFRIGEPTDMTVAILFDDITIGKQVEAELRRNEQQKVFLLKLSDVLRPIADPVKIQSEAARQVGEYLHVARAYYAEALDSEIVTVTGDYAQGVPSVAGIYSLSSFLSQMKGKLLTGHIIIITDTENDPDLTAEQRASYRALQMRALIVVPIVEDGRSVGFFAVGDPLARLWSNDDILLVEAVADRIWAAVIRARSEKALRASEASLTAIFESLPVAVGVADTGGNMTLVNKLMQFFLPGGVMPSSSMIDYQRWTAYKPDGSLLVPAEFPGARALAGERVLPGIEMLYTAEDGSQIWTQVASVPIWNDENRVIGQVTVITDISIFKQAEEVLKKSDRRKNEFLAMLAHELRNPITTIRSGLSILEHTREKPEFKKEVTDMMSRQVDHQVRLVDDLLDISRITQGKINLQKEYLELGALTTASVEAMRPQYDAFEKVLELNLPPSPVFVSGDPTRLNQVVTNLLTNALRYTGDNGFVKVTVGKEGGDAEIRVADNGLGLSADQLTTIFDLFIQVDNSQKRSQAGLGIGLTLVRQIVQLHQGSVVAKSDGIGMGSEFIVRLPLADVAVASGRAGADRASTRVMPAKRHRILVIDDRFDAAMLVSTLLEMRGYEVYVRNSGRDGIDAVSELEPDVILCDIGMPGMDGYETARLLRERPAGAHTFLIALTGYDGEEEKERAREAGFDDFLVKPVDINRLVALLDGLPE